MKTNTNFLRTALATALLFVGMVAFAQVHVTGVIIDASNGETIIGANFVKDLFAGIRDFVGGRSGSYERVLREAKDTSMNEMMERARAMGANAIVGIDIDYETIGANNSMLMVAISGTAVVI